MTGCERLLRIRGQPGFAWRALPGGTHDIVDEQPLAWSRAVLDFPL
jgi:hypothetical protein